MSTGISMNNPTYQRRDIFKVSFGNLETLKLIMEMMQYKQYRKKVRELALDYEINKQLKKLKEQKK